MGDFHRRGLGTVGACIEHATDVLRYVSLRHVDHPENVVDERTLEGQQGLRRGFQASLKRRDEMTPLRKHNVCKISARTEGRKSESSVRHPSHPRKGGGG